MYYAEPPRARVYGEWMLAYEGQDPAEVALPAYLLSRWNGWAVPAFAREQAEEVVRRQEEMRREVEADGPDDGGIAELVWDGDSIVATTSEDPTWREVVQPQLIDGVEHWELGLGWTWETLDFEDPATPTEAQRQAYRALRRSLAEGESIWSNTGVVETDGSHTFSVQRETGRDHPGGLVHMEAVRHVTISPAGECRTLGAELPPEPEPEPESDFETWLDETRHS
jgi:hypothetical protein